MLLIFLVNGGRVFLFDFHFFHWRRLKRARVIVRTQTALAYEWKDKQNDERQKKGEACFAQSMIMFLTFAVKFFSFFFASDRFGFAPGYL